MYTVLSALPAVLALAGFLAYQLLRYTHAGDNITRDIVAKLRREQPEIADRYARLSPSQLHNQLKADRALQQKISQIDFELLRQALRQRFLESLSVYGATLILFTVGIVAFVRTISARPLRLSDFHIESIDDHAKGLAVDTDTLRVTWRSEGTSADVSCYLQNLQTGRRSDIERTSATEQNLLFSPTSYVAVLDARTRGSFNRIRAVFTASNSTFQSEEFKLYVGLTILAFYDSTDN